MRQASVNIARQLCVPALFLLLALRLPAQTGPVTISPGDDIQSIVSANPEGTTFNITPGVYRLQQIQPKNNDIFNGQAGAMLSGAKLLTSFTREGIYWVASGQTQQGQINGECALTSPACAFPEDLFFDNQPLVRVTNLILVTPGSWFFDYPDHKIYFADDPTGHQVETSSARSAFSGSASNVVISGLIVEKYAVPAQFGAIGDQYPGPNWTISGNEVRWNHGAGINLADGSRATQNHVHHNGQKGMGGSGKNLVVDGNDISFNSWAGYDPNWEACGAKFALTSGLVVSSNTVHNNNGVGLWTDIDNIDTVYENNTVFQNKGPGIQHEISYAATISNNIVRSNGVSGASWLWSAQISIQNSRDVQVYGNLVDVAPNTGNGIGVIQQNRGSGAYGPHVAANNYIHDNTIIYRGPFACSGAVADFEGEIMTASGNNVFDYNNYHVPDVNIAHWNWLTLKTWLNIHQVSQELHSTIDTTLPPAQ